jgi:hypothetical protein
MEFVVSGGLTGTDRGGYTTRTTTKRTITSSDNEANKRSVIHGIRPFDQVDLVLQPDNSISSSSTKFLTTSVGVDQSYTPYFALSLHDQSVREGESVLFEVIVSGKYFFL